MSRPAIPCPPSGPGYGRELFGWMRNVAGPADAGASVLFA
jgi:phosphogluconate dehydratase